MKTLYSIAIVVIGCAMLAIAAKTPGQTSGPPIVSLLSSKALWLGLGFPLIALGLHLCGSRLTPVSICRCLSSFFLGASRFFSRCEQDLTVAWSMIRDAPETFRYRRDQKAGC